jgi:hypothetical protein
LRAEEHLWFATSEGGMIARLTCRVKIGYNWPDAVDLS